MPPNEDLLHDLLRSTSRTFALAIPLLPQPVRWEVHLAYLLFRVADTIEDSPFLPRQEKLSVLGRYRERITMEAGGTEADLRLDISRPVSRDPACQLLVDTLPLVGDAARSLREPARTLVFESLARSLAGMEQFVAAGKEDGSLHLRTLPDVRGYCYCVAGLVGEMLTRLFAVQAQQPMEAYRELSHLARWFGEGLQLVNILKDAEADAAEGRRFIPEGMPLAPIHRLAWDDLKIAEQYVSLLRQVHAPAGCIAFAELPLALARRTLECVWSHGPGSKVPKDEVLALVSAAESGLERTTKDRSHDCSPTR